MLAGPHLLPVPRRSGESEKTYSGQSVDQIARHAVYRGARDRNGARINIRPGASRLSNEFIRNKATRRYLYVTYFPYAPIWCVLSR
jgi:hypothetical protein